jgi:formate hydrogenlyase subunit 3/multisubunit Na+/H+ antiporter MnhD subunit
METSLAMTTNWNFLFGAVFALLAACVFLYARSIRQGDGRWWVLALVTSGLALAGTFAGVGLAGTLLIDGAAFAAVALVFVDKNPAARRAARVYLVVVGAAVLALLLGESLTREPGAGALRGDQLAVWLLLAGFALKLALAPVYFWLPAVAESAAPMSVALIISVVDIAAFRELVHLRESVPWVFENHSTVWLAVALLSMFGGALLALGQKNIRRMLAFSTIDDMGYLLLGVIAGTPAGLAGALLGSLAHAVFKVLLFGAVGVAEDRLGHPLSLDDRGLAGRFPWTGAAFIAGALGMVGVPPLLGFAGRWRLYLSGVDLGGVWLGLAMALATILALIYYVRAIHTIWLGPAEKEVRTQPEPRLAAGILIALVAAAILLGLVPAWLLSV